MDNNSKTAPNSSSGKTKDQASRVNNNTQGLNVTSNPTNTSNPSSSRGGNQTNNNNINYSLNRYNNVQNPATANSNSNVGITNDNSVGANYEIIKPNSLSPNYNSSSNISSLPSVESVQAAISSIGANFNEEAIYAELTSQEDNRGYVRRPMNAFMVWSKQARRRIAMAYPNLLNCEISKLLGREWGRMTSKEKEPYVTLSTKLRENHNIMHPDYTYKPRKRRRKGDSKAINEYDSSSMDSPMYGLSKGYSLQNPLYNTNLSTFYTTTSGGGQHRYINPNYSHSSQLSPGSGSLSHTYVPYSNANLMKSMGSSSNPLGTIGMPPLNYQNPSLIGFPGTKLLGSQGSSQMSGLTGNLPPSGSSNVNSSGVTNIASYLDGPTSTGSSSGALNLNSPQFFPSGTNFFSPLGSTSSTINNDNNNSISNEEWRNYLSSIDSAKIGNILNIYGTQDELNQSLGLGPSTSSSGVPGPAGLSLNQAQSLANLGNFCSSGSLFTNTGNTGGGSATMPMGSANNNNQLQQQMSSAMLAPNPYYTMQQTSNILQQYQLDNSVNNSNLNNPDATSQGPNRNNSQQGNPHKDQ